MLMPELDAGLRDCSRPKKPGIEMKMVRILGIPRADSQARRVDTTDWETVDPDACVDYRGSTVDCVVEVEADDLWRDGFIE